MKPKTIVIGISGLLALFLTWNGNRIIQRLEVAYYLAHAVCCLLFLLWFDGRETTP